MKGKGKGKDQMNNKECALQYPDFSEAEDVDCYPVYSSVLAQSDDSEVDIKDISTLQCELEQLLSAVTSKKYKLEEAIKCLPALQEKKSKRNPKEDNEGSNKRNARNKPPKKSEENKGASATPKRPKSKNNQQSRAQDAPAAVQKVQQSDAPHRFWKSLEPYCADITQHHIKFLEEWAKPPADDDEDFKIPPQGNHFSYEWCNKAMQEEQKEGAKACGKRKGLSTSSSLNTDDGEKVLKKLKHDEELFVDDNCPYGFFTCRLVSALLEDNIMSSQEDTDNSSKDLPKPDSELTNRSLIKSLNTDDAVELEERIRKGLEIAGLIETKQAAVEEDSSTDEVLAELQRVQASLRSVKNHNMRLKQKVLKLAKEEVARQELRTKLGVVDAEIMSIMNKMQLAKKKNQATLTKKEEEQAKKLLEERANLLKQIEAMEIDSSYRLSTCV